MRTRKTATVPQRVDFYSKPADLLCFTLAMAGQSSNAIYDALRSAGFDLTMSQIQYRIATYERTRGDGQVTQRRAFRDGKSPVAKVFISQIMSNRGIGHTVKLNAITVLDKKRLYTPMPNGNVVMRGAKGESRVIKTPL